jgi:phage baseplate assembly protein W
MIEDNPHFLGRGWRFPPRFERNTAEVAMTVGIDDIHRSLQVLFTTTLGERVMNPTYGSGLADMVFEPMNTGMIAYIQNLLETAILFHEPRIDAETIAVVPEPLEGMLRIEIVYRVRGANSRFNFVFPFYLTEG